MMTHHHYGPPRASVTAQGCVGRGERRAQPSVRQERTDKGENDGLSNGQGGGSVHARDECLCLFEEHLDCRIAHLCASVHGRSCELGEGFEEQTVVLCT